MAQQYYQNNLGKAIRLTPASKVISQYGSSQGNGDGGNGAYLGVLADWQQVLETPRLDDSPQLEIFTIATYLGSYTLPSGGEGPTRNLSIVGRLEYGIGGTSFQVDFDWKNGNQLSVVASFVRVLAAYSTSTVGDVPTEVTVAAMIASGSRASRSQATKSFPQLLVSAESTVIFPVPPQAHALNLFCDDSDFYDSDEGGGLASIRFLGGANNGFAAASTTDLVSWVGDGVPFLQALATEDGVRLPEACKYVEISTSVEDAEYLVTPSFTLNL